MAALARCGGATGRALVARENGTWTRRAEADPRVVRETDHERAGGVLVLVMRRRPAAVPGVFLLNARRHVAGWRLPGRRRAQG